MPWTKNVHKQLGKRIIVKFQVSAPTACEKVNTVGTDENLFRLVPVPGHGARVLPLKLVPLPGHSAWAPTKGYDMYRLMLMPGHQSEQGPSCRS